MSGRTLIIAEAGVNHNGDMALARQLVDIAAEAGADLVKFQTFRADRLATAAAGGRHAYRTNAIIPGGGKDNTITRAPGSATAQRLRRLAQPWRRVTS